METMFTLVVFFAGFAWFWSGWKKLPIGWQGLRTWLGRRTGQKIEDGWQWASWPWGIQAEDCRARTTELDEMKVFTKDSIEVSIGKTAIIWEIFDVYAYLSLNPGELKKLLDDAVDQNIRRQIRITDFDDIAGMEFGTSAGTLERWGIRVVKIKVPDILPTDKKLRDAIQLAESENRERTGQRVEMKHLGDMVNDLMKPKSEGGHGLNQDQAYEAALLITGKADPKKITGFTLDPATAAAIAAFSGRK